LLADLLEVGYKGRILDLSVERKLHLIAVRTCKIRRHLAVPNGFFEYQIHPLSGSFDEAALGEEVRDPPIAGVLPVKDVVWADAWREASRALNDEAAWKLSNENASARSIIPMAHGIKNSLAYGPFLQRRNVQNEKSVLIMLQIVPEVDSIPEVVVEGEKCFSVFLALLRRSRRFSRSIFENHLCLSQVFSYYTTRTEKN
jgi:hypothetical protein